MTEYDLKQKIAECAAQGYNNTNGFVVDFHYSVKRNMGNKRCIGITGEGEVNHVT